MFLSAMKILKDPLSQARRLGKELAIDQAESLSSQDLAEALRNVCPKNSLLVWTA